LSGDVEMTGFLIGQLDYIFFLYGLSFLLLAVMVHNLGHQTSDVMPWRWLAGFGLLHGANEWLDLLALSLGDDPPFVLIRLALMATSFLCLLEFGRARNRSLGEVESGTLVRVTAAGAGAAGWLGWNVRTERRNSLRSGTDGRSLGSLGAVALS